MRKLIKHNVLCLALGGLDFVHDKDIKALLEFNVSISLIFYGLQVGEMYFARTESSARRADLSGNNLFGVPNFVAKHSVEETRFKLIVIDHQHDKINLNFGLEGPDEDFK